MSRKTGGARALFEHYFYSENLGDTHCNKFKISLTEQKSISITQIKRHCRFLDNRTAPSHTSFFKRCKASLTVEASFVLPIFFLALMCVVYLFQVELLQQQIRSGLYEAAEEMALSAYVTDNGEQKQSFSLAKWGLESVTGTANVTSEIEDPGLLRMVVGGRAGIVCTANTKEENYVNLNATCLIRFPITFFGKKTFLLQEHARVRKWTGFDPSELTAEDAEEMVYITPEGVAYHKDRACSYLNPSIRSVPTLSVEMLRNSSGHKYYACPLCAKNNVGSTVLITTYGENYHTSATCSGLKRTIYCVSISEVGGRHACSKCGH